MLRRVLPYWRVFGTGLGFLAVGVGGVLVFPLINVFIRRRQLRTEVARDLIGFTFHCIVRSMRAMGVFRYEIKGLERLERRGLLILANHPTLIDIVFLMAFVKRADCIIKSALWRNPFTHCTVRAAAYIRNDDDGTRLVEDCVAAIRNGNNLIIFPEGTRTSGDGSITLKRGAANIAVRARRNVTPVLIRCAAGHACERSEMVATAASPVAFQHRSERRHRYSSIGRGGRQRGFGSAPFDRAFANFFYPGMRPPCSRLKMK